METLKNGTKVVILDDTRNDSLTSNCLLRDFKIGIIVDRTICQYKILDYKGDEHYLHHENYGKDFVTIDFYKLLLKDFLLRLKQVESEANETLNMIDYISNEQNFSDKARCLLYEYRQKNI